MTGHHPKTPSQLKGLSSALETARSCVRCGACMAVCPVYQAGRKEELSPRGKLLLIRALEEGGAGQEAIAQALEQCLLCGRCSAGCANQVWAHKGVEEARAALSRSGLSLKGAALQTIFGDAARLNALMQAGRISRPMLERAVPLLSGLHLRLAGLMGADKLPLPARFPFLVEAGEEVPGPAGAERVIFFVGCGANHLRPGLAQRAVGLLARYYTVIISREQLCCGLPAIAAGERGLAQELAARNLTALGGIEATWAVTTCGSCAYALKERWPLLAPPRQEDAARELAAKVVEISQVLPADLELAPAEDVPPGPVAVHDPCHLKTGLGVWAQPREMLSRAGIELREMSGADACCGGGGLFSLTQAGLSREILDCRLKAFRESGARVLASSCSGCFLQWRLGLPREIPVVHPVELIQAA